MTMIYNNIIYDSIYPSTVVGPCIEMYENVWPNWEETIKNLDLAAEQKDSGIYWKNAETLNFGITNYRSNYDMPVSYLAKNNGNPLVANIHNQMNSLLISCSMPYVSKYEIKEQIYHEDYVAIKYKSGQHYKAHYDGPTSLGRCLSGVLYLNDNYEGGEIEFVNFNIKIKPSPGTLIIFPSNYAYTHIAHPVTFGTKYALVAWLHDRPIS